MDRSLFSFLAKVTGVYDSLEKKRRNKNETLEVQFNIDLKR